MVPQRQLIAAIALGLVVALPALAQPPNPGVERLTRAPGATFHLTPIGLCEDYPEETTTAAIYNADFELLRRTGVDLLRISFGWDGIEEEQGQYEWLFWDDFVRTAVDDYGITLIPYIMYTPMWNASQQDDNFWRSPPVDYDAFGEFVYHLVSRYRDRIKSWELWNEADIVQWWTGTPAEFARLVKVGSEAVRRADPEAIVVLGGIAKHPEFVEQLFRHHGVSPYVDVVNMHNYFETWHHAPVENIGEYIRHVAEAVGRYGNGQALWLAEVGYSTVRVGPEVSYSYKAYYDYEHTPEFQAVQLVRTVTAALATDLLSAVAWYEVKDLPPTEEVIGDNNNRHLGVAYADHTPKPAEHALAFVNRLYGKPMRSIDREVTMGRALNSDAFVHAFEQEDGDVIVVGWLQTRQIGRQDIVGDGMHRDTRHEHLEVVIPRPLAGAATGYDELGTAHGREDVRREGAQTVVPLRLEGGKIAIVHVAQR
jgi:polysaccharide biosynthesis protein PslG